MGEVFEEYDWKAAEIERIMEIMMTGIEIRYEVQFREPHHDITRRFLNEIVEFKPLEG